MKNSSKIMNIVVIDYGIGNIKSIKMLCEFGVK